MTTVLPRLLAALLLLVSLAMVIPLSMAVAGMFRGQEVPGSALAIPLVFLGTGCILTWLLARRTLNHQLFIMAFALWLVAAGYYFFTLMA